MIRMKMMIIVIILLVSCAVLRGFDGILVKLRIRSGMTRNPYVQSLETTYKWLYIDVDCEQSSGSWTYRLSPRWSVGGYRANFQVYRGTVFI